MAKGPAYYELLHVLLRGSLRTCDKCGAPVHLSVVIVQLDVLSLRQHSMYHKVIITAIYIDGQVDST